VRERFVEDLHAQQVPFPLASKITVALNSTAGHLEFFERLLHC